MSYILKHGGQYYIGNTGNGSVWRRRHYFAKRFADPSEWRAWIVSHLQGFAGELDFVRVVRLIPKRTGRSK